MERDVIELKKIKLGHSSLEVSIIGLGAINFGTTTDEKTSFDMLDKYVEHGGNFIDTANNYAVWNGGDGSESEKTIGKWLEKRSDRENLVISTKLGALPKDMATKDFSNMQGLSRNVIVESVNKSLENLKTDVIDLLYMHVDDDETPQEETLETLNELIKNGLVKEIGCSNFRTWRIESARQICEKYRYKFFCAVQQRFSYLAPVSDADFYPQVAYNQELQSYINWYKDLTLVAYSPLLGGQYIKTSIESDAYKTLYNEQKLKDLIRDQNDPNVWVLNFITKQHGGSVALYTTTKVAHLEHMMISFDSEIDDRQ